MPTPPPMTTPNISGHSPPEEEDDDPNIAGEEQWSPQGPGSDLASPSTEGIGASSSSGQRSIPLQKRRRVTRACDECRRKKIKCDGKQPCTHCTVYSYDCTYDQPSNRRRNPAPQYIEALETRLHRAEALLKSICPEIDLDDPKLRTNVPNRTQLPINPAVKIEKDGDAKTGPEVSNAQTPGWESDKDSLLESMVQNTGSLDLDDRGNWDFHGHSSGLVFLRRMRQQFGDLMGDSEIQGSTFLKMIPARRALDSPMSIESPTDPSFPITADLPSKEYGRSLCENALDDACALMRFAHKPTFYAMFDRIYDTPPEQYGNEENKYLPLVYAVMAVGSLFAKTENSKLEREGYEGAIDQGYKYFRAARQLMDITDCRDLPSLQVVICMIMFLQSSARLATCFSYIGIALHSAIRMGLHRSITRNFNPIELETRKRMFWQIRKMDIYVGAMLGLPMMLSDDDIDQELPEEVEDEYITAEKILPMPPGQLAFITATNAHTKLVKVLQKVVRYIYPIKGVESGHDKPNPSYVVSHAKIREIERDLQEWMENLPMGLRPSSDASPELTRVQQLLRMAYAHVQMILYRPFLHYVSYSCQSRNVDKRSYACAAAGVSISRNVIHITAEMKRRGLLIGAYWFTMYTTFFAILALVFFILENPESVTTQDILKDAMEGKEILASLAKRSMAADRCTITLQTLFGHLPEKLKRGRLLPATAQKKRHAQSPVPILKERGNHSLPNIPSTRTDQPIPSNEPSSNKRASTCPNETSFPTWKRSSVLYQDTSPVTDTFRRSSYDVYPQSSSDHAGIMSPTSPTTSAPYTSQAPFPIPQQSPFNTGFQDFSALMFPSADPFAYPIQPMTTLENRHFTKHDDSFPNPSLYTANSTSPYDNLEVQLFGPLPPYLMQAQQPAGLGMQNMSGPMEMSGSQGESGMMAMSGMDARWMPQSGGTGRTPGVNMDELIGEEWKAGWLEGGFGQ